MPFVPMENEALFFITQLGAKVIDLFSGLDFAVFHWI